MESSGCNMTFSPNSHKAESLVLVVTTDEAVSLWLRAELERRGCTVVVTSGVIDAIAELHGVEFDLAFVALHLPPRSGLDLVRVAHTLSPATEVIVIINPDQQDKLVDCVRTGAVDFLHQPMCVDVLDTILSQSTKRREDRASTAMFQASHTILTGTDGKQLPSKIVDVAVDLLAADGIAYLRDQGDGSLAVAHSCGFSKGGLSELVAIAELVIRERMTATAVPILLPDDLRGLRDLREHLSESSSGNSNSNSRRTQDDEIEMRFSQMSGGRIRGAIICPVSIEGRAVGVLAAQRSVDPRPFRRADAERAGVLASQLRLALDNARLVEKTVTNERLAAIGELAAGVAHEINSPLMYVLQNCTFALERLASSDVHDKDLRAALTDAIEGAERIKDIANDLKTLVRDKSCSEAFEINEAVRAALRVAGSTLRGVVNVETRLGEGTMIEGQPGRMCQVFVNLLVNAAHAARGCKRSVAIEIETRLDPESGRIVASVRDTGPGISKEHLGKIFETFFTTKGSAGTGLGLAITQAIIADHGGAIKVASEVGEGTTFVIDLPAMSQSTKRAA
jgi:signal transduction histidine kinase/ActR/RegA family two-component response regulator